MENNKGKIRIVNNKIFITIPSIIQESMLQSLTTTSANDVTASYNVILLNNKNQRLYVNNLEDFRKVLKQFYIYKKLCTIIQNAAQNLKLKLTTDNKCSRAVNKNDTVDKDAKQNISHNTDNTNVASTSATGPSKISFTEHDDDLITCHQADESKKCATTRVEPCPESCSRGIYLEMLPEGKQLLRKKGCCAVM